MNRIKRKVGVVLSGGGAKGAYEAGALCSIVKKIPQIHVVTGASIGAINGAVFALEYEKTGDIVGAAETVKSLWSDLGSLFRISPWHIVLNMFVSYFKTRSPLQFPALIDSTGIENKLEELIPRNIRISDLSRIELAINATCLTSGQTVSFTRENDAFLYDAVLASSSIPIAFASRFMNGAYYVDGGVFNNTPLRDAIRAQATDIFIVELKPKSKTAYMQEIQDAAKFDNVYAVGGRLLELIFDKMMYEDLKNARKINDIVDVILQLQAAGASKKALQDLKKAIGYEKDGTIKRHINFYEIAPSKRLEPPGTLGFDKKDAIQEIIRLGEMDAEKQLKDILVGWGRAVS